LITTGCLHIKIIFIFCWLSWFLSYLFYEVIFNQNIEKFYHYVKNKFRSSSILSGTGVTTERRDNGMARRRNGVTTEWQRRNLRYNSACVRRVSPARRRNGTTTERRNNGTARRRNGVTMPRLGGRVSCACVRRVCPVRVSGACVRRVCPARRRNGDDGTRAITARVSGA